MEHSRENIVKLFRAIYKNCHEVAKSVPALHSDLVAEAIAFDTAASLITDKTRFDDYCRIFNLKESEDD